ncbi:MAG: 3-methyl-2-oxobutanoate hydroxymethyltransferase [Candidatus Cloacimonetes bacterium 4572_65]|nr:MAG: 3-methyl-2-oxobutanoate hydroxymethyltransferase [Candidatus Cloacimonetes bacterium 4572_65]
MLNVRSFKKMKKSNNNIVMVTAYDYPSGRLVEASKSDIILVGDSLGMVVLGYESTLQVTLEDIIHHSKATRRGAKDTFIVADMPFMSYHLDINNTKLNASRLIIEGKANAVKVEGGSDSRLEVIRAITDCEIPVVAHLGLTPQSINKFGGYRVQGKSETAYKQILQEAIAIQEAGAFMVVLEGVPEKLAKEISETLSIPTIGIGAGRYCDGQVLVYHDIIGSSDYIAKFVKVYADVDKIVLDALTNYVNDVKGNSFPEEKHTYFPIEG